MTSIERGKLDAKIKLLLKSGSSGVAGLTSGDLTIRYFNADGAIGTLSGFSLSEVDSANFAGVYLLSDYNDTLVDVAGPAGIKVSGAGFDTISEDIDVSESLEWIKKLYQLGFLNLVWNIAESRWDLKDASDVLVGWFPAEDVNGNPAIIDGTHPVSRLIFVPAP